MKLRATGRRGYDSSPLALLWQIFFRPRAAEPYSTVRASLQWSHNDADDGVTHGGQAWLRWRSVDSFFPVSLGLGDDAEGRRKRSLSLARVGEGLARIGPRSG